MHIACGSLPTYNRDECLLVPEDYLGGFKPHFVEYCASNVAEGKDGTPASLNQITYATPQRS